MNPSIWISSLVLAGSVTAQQQGIVLESPRLPPQQVAPSPDESAIPLSASPDQVGHSFADGRRGIHELDGDLWGYGRAYRSGFEVGAVEFTPAFGKAAPRNFPVRFSLDSIHRGSQELRGARVRPELLGDRAIYAHASGVLERYECTNSGMELSFEFTEPVEGEGDLVVRMRMESELIGVPGRHLTGLELDATPYGAVTIGGVTGIDAAGRRCAGWLNHDQGWLEMVLPADFVATAAWPLVLDPLIGSRVSAGISFDDKGPDIAYDDSNDVYLASYYFDISVSDADVLAQRLRGSDGARLGGHIPIGVGSGLQTGNAVGNVNARNLFAVAWMSSQTGGSSGNWDVLVRRVSPDGSTGPVVTVANSARPELHPDVAGDATLVDDEVIIAWEDRGGVGFRACQFTPSSNVVFDYTDIPAPAAATEIAISKSGGTTGQYLFVWKTHDSRERYVGLRQGDRNLTLQQGTYLIPMNGTFLRSVEVDSDGSEWLIVYARNETASAIGPTDVYGHHVQIVGSGLGSATGSFVIENDAGESEFSPAVAYLGHDQFVVTWTDYNAATGERPIQMTNVIRRSRERCGREHSVRISSGAITIRNAIASKRSGGDSSDHCMFVWENRNAKGQSLVFRHRYEARGAGGAIRNLRGACGQGGTITTSGGPLAFGNRDFKIELWGVNGGRSTVSALSFGIGNSPRFFRCGGPCAHMFPDLAATVRVDANGNAVVPLPVQCGGQLYGFTFAAQFVSLTPNVNPCGLARVSLSDTLLMTQGE